MSLSDDRTALRDLAARYCSAVDDSDATRMAGLFAANGKLIVYATGAQPGDSSTPLRTWQGSEAFARLIGVLATSYVRWVHFLGNHWVDINGAHASGEAYLFACHLRRTPAGHTEEEVAIIRYRDLYERTAEGWRFSERHAYRQWTTVRPIDQGAHEIDTALMR